MAHWLAIEALSAAAFRPFGEVIEARAGSPAQAINGGTALRFDALARVAAGGGDAVISLFRAEPRQLPMQLLSLERHPLGSQAFMPLSRQPYLVVVAAAGAAPTLPALHCFLAGPDQGINLATGTWHHALLALNRRCDFLVVDRAADGQANCDEVAIAPFDAWLGFADARQG